VLLLFTDNRSETIF